MRLLKLSNIRQIQALGLWPIFDLSLRFNCAYMLYLTQTVKLNSMQMKWLEGNLEQTFKFLAFSISKVLAYEEI